jgi:hypothetical protein
MKRTTSIYSETLDRDISVEFEIFWNQDPRTETTYRDFKILDLGYDGIHESEVEAEIEEFLKDNLAEYIEDDTDLFSRD